MEGGREGEKEIVDLLSSAVEAHVSVSVCVTTRLVSAGWEEAQTTKRIPAMKAQGRVL